jgi:hypothetical protein
VAELTGPQRHQGLGRACSTTMNHHLHTTTASGRQQAQHGLGQAKLGEAEQAVRVTSVESQQGAGSAGAAPIQGAPPAPYPAWRISDSYLIAGDERGREGRGT